MKFKKFNYKTIYAALLLINFTIPDVLCVNSQYKEGQIYYSCSVNMRHRDIGRFNYLRTSNFTYENNDRVTPLETYEWDNVWIQRTDDKKSEENEAPAASAEEPETSFDEPAVEATIVDETPKSTPKPTPKPAPAFWRITPSTRICFGRQSRPSWRLS